MSRDLTADEANAFHGIYATGKSCVACGSRNVAIRIWEKYGTTAKKVGGDIGPDSIVAAVVICADCGHGETIARPQLLKAKSVA